MLKTDQTVHVQVKLTKAEFAALDAMGGDVKEVVRQALEEFAASPPEVSGLVGRPGDTRLMTVPIRKELYEAFLQHWSYSPYDYAVRRFLAREGVNDGCAA